MWYLLTCIFENLIVDSSFYSDEHSKRALDNNPCLVLLIIGQFGQPGFSLAEYDENCFVGLAPKQKEYTPCRDVLKPSWPNSVYRWLQSFQKIF